MLAPMIAEALQPNLVQTGDKTSFAMILYSKTLDASAQAAIVESARLDLLEAPQRPPLPCAPP